MRQIGINKAAMRVGIAATLLIILAGSFGSRARAQESDESSEEARVEDLNASAEAPSSLFHPSLVKAIQELDAATGPETYAALRNVWRTWDRANPDQVEAALRAAETSSRLSPAERVYAATLTAFARTRRGDLSDARRRFQDLGFVDQWLFVGPFDNEGKAGFDRQFEPERDIAAPLVQGRAFAGKERPVRWRVLPSAFPYGWLAAGAVARPDSSICAYAMTFVQDKTKPKQARPITVWVGAGGAFKLFFNATEVMSDGAYRQHDIDRYAATVTLNPGLNSIVLKMCGEAAAPIASLRVGDARGAPDSRLVFSARPEDSVEAAKSSGTPLPPQTLLGPMQQLERRVAGAHPSAQNLEAFARYLVTTKGDDKAVHRARDLATRAAEASPTIPRYLLAATLAEDRNQRARWIEQAVALLPKSPKYAIDVKLSQARLARESLNWREAFPFYDEILRLDPDNVAALRGKVELFNEAGLKRTALELLSKAVAKNPHSLTLLNMYASELKALGHSTEAAEIESRYAAYRFDDRGYLSSRIDLAVAKRDATGAEYWIGRLLELDPDDVWSYGIAARAYRSLGQTERAAAAYASALELVPEEVSVLQKLSDLQGELGNRQEQLALLHRIVELRPQAKEVREYIEHIEPESPRVDEAYAYQPSIFLKERGRDAGGQNRRTLLDLTVTTVFDNGLSSKFRQVVFQPLTDSAAALTRQYSFQYQADKQRVQLRGARIFRSDGRVDEAIESGEGSADDPSIAMYTSDRTFYVQFPRLDPGDVVELRYRVDDVVSKNEFADYFGELVYLQSSEPVAHGEYVLITPKSRKFYIDHQGIPGLRTSTTTAKDTTTYRFIASDLPEIAPEPAMPPWTEVLGFIHVSTFASFADLGKWYWGLAQDQFDLDDETRKLAHEITKDTETEADKVRAVYDWVVKNTRYVALELGIYGYKPRRSVQTVSRGWGDCKDKATVIVSLLKAIGIDSTIVVLRTGMHGDFRSSVASLAPYDHAIAYVPSLGIYLDGTAQYSGSSELPEMDLSGLGIQINQGAAKVVRLPAPDPQKDVTLRKITAAVRPDGSASLNLGYEISGTSAAEWRARYQADATQRQRITADLANEFPGLDLDQIKTGKLDDLEVPVSLTLQGKAPEFARREGSQLSMAVTTNARLTPSFASLSKRKLDLRVPATTIDDTFTVKVPKGYRVRSAPPATTIEDRFGSVLVEVEQTPTEVRVRSRLAVKVSRVTPAEYPAWQAFAEKADRAFLPRLVIGAE
jgi:transglutaminase-like putative cysteine protease/Tfp pilus assembly protein PilF